MFDWFTCTQSDDVAFVQLSDDIGCYGRPAAKLQTEIGGAQRVELSVCSAGGDSSVGIQIFDLLTAVETEVVVSGRAWSAALTAAMAARRIRMVRTGSLLIHPPMLYVAGSADDLRREASALEKLTLRIRDIIVQRSERPVHVVERWLSKDSFFTAEEALEGSLVDELIDPPPAPRLRRRSTAAVPDHCAGEEVFRSWLKTLGPIKVRDREKFARELDAWFARNVSE